MSDIVIIRSKYRALVKANSTRGYLWLASNIDTINILDTYLTIDLDLVNEFTEDLIKEGLEVEVR